MVDNIWNHPFLDLGGNWCNAIKIELNNEKDESLQTIGVHHCLIGHFSYRNNGADQSQARVYHHEQCIRGTGNLIHIPFMD